MSDALYHETIKALARAGYGSGRLAAPDAVARLDNPLCGDRIDLDVCVTDGRIAAIGYEVKGCLLCRAAAAVVGLRAPGCNLFEIEAARAGLADFLAGVGAAPSWEELLAFAPVCAHPSRHGCVKLPIEALWQAMAGIRGSDGAIGGAPAR